MNAFFEYDKTVFSYQKKLVMLLGAISFFHETYIENANISLENKNSDTRNHK